MKSSYFMLGLFLSHLSVAWAAEGCHKPKTPYDQTYCTAKLFLEADKELNEVYGSLKSTLPKNLKEKLTLTQRKWISFRDENCSKQGTIEVNCNLSINKLRAEYLRDRLRECKIGHCREDLISAEAFALPENAGS